MMNWLTIPRPERCFPDSGEMSAPGKEFAAVRGMSCPFK